MAEIWLNKIGGYAVEKHPIGRSGGRPLIPLTTGADGNGILHTTEGKGVAGALSTLAGNNVHGVPDPSTFVVGEHRIIQCRPLGVQAASLVGPQNAYAYVQIEMVAITAMAGGQPALWLPDADVLEPMIEIMRFFANPTFGIGKIPLQVPVEHWLDDGSDMKTMWATNNTRRQEAVAKHYWPTAHGWWMHAEVPFQAKTWHYDCGKLERRKMFVMAGAKPQAQPTPENVATGHLAPFTPSAGYDPRVKAIQQQLLAHMISLPTWGADGKFGGETQRGIVAWEAINQRPHTGTITEWLLTSLNL